MANRTFISFDWAIKKILRHKENFDILEGFLSELLGFDVFIQNLLESEANKQSENDKFDRVDILVQTRERELMLIEIQYDDEEDYFHRMVYGISKLISEYIHEGQRYGQIKKAYSINILYFRLGQGKDYIYEYQGSFIGRNKKDILNPTNYQKQKYAIQSVADIFPKYYILRVGSFRAEKPIEPIDEWFYFLKNSEIKEGFKAKGMERAKSVLRYETMAQDDKQAYKRHIENRRIENAVIETAEDKAARRKSIEIAKNALSIGANIDFVVNITGLKMPEVVLLSEGKDLDVENDDV
jgi:predicted transposase/invertase (TIGR01784 family)